MELKYEIPTKAYLLDGSDEYEYDYEIITFCPDNEDLIECVATCIFNEYFEEGMYDSAEREDLISFISRFIDDKSLVEQMAEDYKDKVYERFRKEAIKEYHKELGND